MHAVLARAESVRHSMEESPKLHFKKHMVRCLPPVLMGERRVCSSPIIAGWTYCGVGVLRLLGTDITDTLTRSSSDKDTAINEAYWQDLLHWLVSRQTTFVQELENEPWPEGENLEADETNVRNEEAQAAEELETGKEEQIERTIHALACAGFNGRCNKVADTCYAFWVGGSLAVRKRSNLDVVSC